MHMPEGQAALAVCKVSMHGAWISLQFRTCGPGAADTFTPHAAPGPLAASFCHVHIESLTALPDDWCALVDEVFSMHLVALQEFTYGIHCPAAGGEGKGPALPARLRARLRMEHWDWLHLGLASGLGLVSLLYMRSLLHERQLAASLHKKDRAMARYVMQVGVHLLTCLWPTEV